MTNKTHEYDYMLYIGRFQPCHIGHIQTIKKALTMSNMLIVCIGSVNQPRTIKNPWTYQERRNMISSNFSKSELLRIQFSPLSDHLYNDQNWIEQVQNVVGTVVESYESSHDGDIDKASESIGIVGYHKDDTSFYLKLFPQWHTIQMENISGYNATDIRNFLFDRNVYDFTKPEALTESVFKYICSIPKSLHNNMYDMLAEEWEYINDYKKDWENAPYPPTFVTVDAVVIQSGHILLIKRKEAPGKGLWAIPGGFLDPDEQIVDGMVRELREETKVKLPIPVLKGSIVSSKVFDHPRRSLRGRSITHAFLIRPADGPLPKVKGADDAEKAKWVSLIDFRSMEPQLFEDHYHIISYFLGQV